jgi:hypothetical protein
MIELRTYSPEVRDFGVWLNSFRWQAMATMTYDREPSIPRAQAQFNDFIQQLGNHELKVAVGCVAAIERRGSGVHVRGGRLHWHALLTAKVPPSKLVRSARRLWSHRQDGGICDVETYVPGAGGTYLMKVAFHDSQPDYYLINHEAFQPDPDATGAEDLWQSRQEDDTVPADLRQFNTGSYLTTQASLGRSPVTHPGVRQSINLRFDAIRQRSGIAQSRKTALSSYAGVISGQSSN